jgi:hypothetical protein
VKWNRERQVLYLRNTLKTGKDVKSEVLVDKLKDLPRPTKEEDVPRNLDFFIAQ